MRRLGRVVFVLLSAVIGLLIVCLIGANLYVQSSGAQAKIQQELSRRLGTRLELRQISVTPWGGLKLSGITIPQNLPGHSGNFLEAKTFRLRLRLSALFSKRFVIRDVSLVNPTVVWPQDERGKWRLPGSRAEEPAAAAPATMPLPEPSPPETISTPGSPPAIALVTPGPANISSPEKTGEGPKFNFQPEIRRIYVADGNFHFVDRSGKPAAIFETVNFHSVLDGPATLHGQAKIGKVSVRDRFFLTDVQTPVRYEPAELALPKITAHAASGELFGEFVMHPETEESPFSLSIRFRNLEADQVVTEAGGPKGMVQGKVEGSFEGRGSTSRAESLSGSGEMILHDGQLRQYSLLAALGQVLQIEELTQLHLEQAEAKYHVDPGIVTIDQMVLRSPNIRLSAKGTVGFDGKLQLDSQLAINDKLRGQLFKPIRQNFQPIADAGYSAVDFHVTGTLERPKSDLMERLVGRDLKDLGSVINSFLGGSKSDKPKKKRRLEQVPSESAAQGQTDSSSAESATPTPSPASTP